MLSVGKNCFSGEVPSFVVRNLSKLLLMLGRRKRNLSKLILLDIQENPFLVSEIPQEVGKVLMMSAMEKSS